MKFWRIIWNLIIKKHQKITKKWCFLHIFVIYFIFIFHEIHWFSFKLLQPWSFESWLRFHPKGWPAASYLALHSFRFQISAENIKNRWFLSFFLDYFSSNCKASDKPSIGCSPAALHLAKLSALIAGLFRPKGLPAASEAFSFTLCFKQAATPFDSWLASAYGPASKALP